MRMRVIEIGLRHPKQMTDHDGAWSPLMKGGAEWSWKALSLGKDAVETGLLCFFVTYLMQRRRWLITRINRPGTRDNTTKR